MAKSPQRPNESWHLTRTEVQPVTEAIRPTVVEAFSLAGPPTAQAAPTAWADDGARHVLELDDTGTVRLLHGDEEQPLVDATTREQKRGGTPLPGGAPKFSLLAANSGRFFAKEQGALRFWFGTFEPLDVVEADGGVAVVPNSYFALDPEAGAQGASVAALVKPMLQRHGRHPGTQRLGFLAEVMKGAKGLGFEVAFPEALTWHWLDVRPPPVALSLGDDADEKAPWWRSLLNLDPYVSTLLSLHGLSRTLPRVNLRRIGALVKASADAAAAKLRGTQVAPNASQLPDAPDVDGLRLVPIARYEKTDRQLNATAPNAAPTVATFALEQHQLAVAAVLDVGVGHAHLHEQWETRYGGEIQPLRVLHPLLQNERLNALSYRFFNGPVHDGDGFIDGTCNYYVLAQLSPRAGGARYGLLWTDEQTYFSGRLRLLHPTHDTEGLGFALCADLKKQPHLYDFDVRAFWCPFDAGCVNAASRLAVSRQVVCVTGRHAGVDELYSINFSWSTCDRTWRWRPFPAPVDALGDSVDPQTVALREDMTLSVAGTKTVEGAVVPGRWFQKYLPADNLPVPRFTEAPPKNASSRPKAGYPHAWDFLPDDAWALATKATHFGVYDAVHSRCQAYRVEVADAVSEATLRRFGEAQRWDAAPGALYVNTLRLDWQAPHPRGIVDLKTAVTSDGELPWTRATPSLYVSGPDDGARLTLRHRGGAGWLALYWDKRDDDLMTLSSLPRRARLTRHGGAETVDVVLTENVVSFAPPEVVHAAVSLRPEGAHLHLKCVGPQARHTENVWRARIAAHVDGAVVSLLDSARPEWTWDAGAQSYAVAFPVRDAQRELLTGAGRRRFATSLWFEDALGHVATAEWTDWAESGATASSWGKAPSAST